MSEARTPAATAPAEPRPPDLSPRAERLALLGRLLVLLSACCAVALALAFARPVLRGAPVKPTGPTYSTVYGPTVPNDNDRFRVVETDAEGFIVHVESAPAGAQVRINDVDQGRTPSSSTLECEPGQPLQISVTLAGYAPLRYATTCSENRLIQLRAPLKRQRSKP